MPQDRFFGYGSLVNAGTHHRSLFVEPFTLKGWRRAWAYRTRTKSGQRVVSLTAAPCLCLSSPPGDPPCENCAIDGLLISAGAEDFTILDKREHGYDRLPIKAGFVYSAKPENRGGVRDGYKILQSYADAVCQGYLRVFGESGLKRFVETTDGWDGDFLNDRPDPLYPRAVVLLPAERTLIDRCIAATRTGQNV